MGNNGDSMVKFRTGIFLAGLPLQPVAISSPFRHFSISWESIRFNEHLFRTMTQFYNNVEVTLFPIYSPSKEEQQNAKLFAINVQSLFAKTLNQSVYLLNRKHKMLYHKTLLGKLETEEALQQAKEVTLQDATLSYYISNNI